MSEIAERFIEGEPLISETPMTQNARGSRIRGMGQEDASYTEQTITYDILFRAVLLTTGEPIELIINVEAQGKYHTGYPLTKRGIYYTSRMISSQYGREFTHSHYEKIRKVYSIWVCTDPPKERQNTITKYEITEQCVVGDTREARENYDLQTVVMIYLGGKDSGNYTGLLKLLGTLLSKRETANERSRVLREEFHLAMTETIEGEVSKMGNIAQAFIEEGIREGLEKGLKEGMEKGLKEGMMQARKEFAGELEANTRETEERTRAETALYHIRSLMDSTGWSANEAMSMLRIPAQQRQGYLAKLQMQ